MASAPKAAAQQAGSTKPAWMKSEDWWAVIIGLVLVLIVWAAQSMGTPLAFINHATPATWPTNPLGAHFAGNWPAYIGLFALLAVATSLAIYMMTGTIGNYLKGFVILFVAGLVIMILSSQATIKTYGLENAFWALVIGLVVGNLWKLPDWFNAAAGRTEFFIKMGIILLGANLSFQVIVSGGVWGFLEAATIVTVGFTTAFLISKKLGFDNKFAAVLGAGGSVCGVSASIAVGGSVKADEKHVGYIISLVVLYALVLIFLLPALGKAIGLNDHVLGAWIGGSELADAAGLAAAAMVSDEAVQAFTLVKLNRDVMVGVLCFIMATLAITKWDVQAAANGKRPSAKIIWDRFPKFVLAFVATSIFITFVQGSAGSEFSGAITKSLNVVRGWLFTLAFLCIGLNTKIKDVRAMGIKPIIAFTTVVLVNVTVGFILANLFFGGIIAAPLG